MRNFLMIMSMILSMNFVYAQEVDSAQLFLDAFENGLHYQQGEVTLDGEIGTLKVPEGFSFLDKSQAQNVLQNLWGNPEDASTLGLIVPTATGVTKPESWAFIVSYEEMGYVKDDDADDINYDELLEDMKKDIVAENEARVKEGYESYELIGWASQPYYDADKKVLHWAKEIKFGDSQANTLNYNVRVLGRKGVVVLNAVAGMNQLPEVKTHIDPILASFTYADGNKYKDFNPDIDEVAAWTIGGLVAGKILAKVGIFALLLKNIKLIGLGIAAMATAAWRWFKGRTQPAEVRTIAETPDTSENKES